MHTRRLAVIQSPGLLFPATMVTAMQMWSRLVWSLASVGLVLLALPPVVTLAAPPSELPLVFAEDFEAGHGRWDLADPASWALENHGRGHSLCITQRESAYQPKVRSPLHVALISDVKLHEFVLTFDVKSTKDTGNHRDCCVLFGHQDAEHFYYVHLGAKPDPASGQIMIVNGEPRRPLTQNTQRVPWGADWHSVKVQRTAGSGLIQVYFDSLDQPLMEISDTTFGSGRIGLGSFDDMDAFDNIRLYGTP